MTTPTLPGQVQLSPAALHTLHTAIDRVAAGHAPALLQEAGYAAGTAMYGGFGAWLQPRAGVSDPGALDAGAFWQMLGTFFTETGWGPLQVSPLGSSAFTLDATAWAEAAGRTGATQPSCHFTTGMLAGFMSAFAGSAVAVMQVECLTCGHARCRFLAASPAVLQQAFEAMSRGESYESYLAGAPSS